MCNHLDWMEQERVKVSLWTSSWAKSCFHNRHMWQMLFLGYLKTIPNPLLTGRLPAPYGLESSLLTSSDFLAARVECQVLAEEKEDVFWGSSWERFFFLSCLEHERDTWSCVGFYANKVTSMRKKASVWGWLEDKGGKNLNPWAELLNQCQ